VAARVAQLVLAGAFGTLIFVTWKVVGDSSNIRNSDGGFLQGLHCDQCAICNHSTSICHRMSLALKSTRVSHFEAKRGKQGLLTDVSQILLWSRRHGAVVCKRNRVDIFCRLSTMHERDRQTDRQSRWHMNETYCTLLQQIAALTARASEFRNKKLRLASKRRKMQAYRRHLMRYRRRLQQELTTFGCWWTTMACW